MDIKEIAKYISDTSPETKIYIGCDSEVVKDKKVRYTIVVVVHIDGSKGAKVFGGFEHERNVDNIKKPFYRLMNEVYKVSNLYLKLADAIGDRTIEVHLDLNSNDKHISNKVAKQALGYVKGVCGVDAKLKPDAFAASFAADRFYHFLNDGNTMNMEDLNN